MHSPSLSALTKRPLSILVLVGAFSLSTAPSLAQIRPNEALEGANIAPVAKTGQTVSYAPGDDGDVEAGVSGASPRFTDGGDGTVSDTLTSLIWTKDAGHYEHHWADALNYCRNYPSGVPAGWRLPNFRELMSLLDFGQKFPMLPLNHPFINLVSDHTGIYWSSTTNIVYDSLSKANAINFGTGDVRLLSKLGGAGYLLCVRNK